MVITCELLKRTAGNFLLIIMQSTHNTHTHTNRQFVAERFRERNRRGILMEQEKIEQVSVGTRS